MNSELNAPRGGSNRPWRSLSSGNIHERCAAIDKASEREEEQARHESDDQSEHQEELEAGAEEVRPVLLVFPFLVGW